MPLLSYMKIKLPCAHLQRVAGSNKATTSWFDVKGFPVTIHRADPGTGQQESIARVLSAIDDAIASGIPPSHIVIGGHSQGGALALAVALKSNVALAGCIMLAGWILPWQNLASCAMS